MHYLKKLFKHKKNQILLIIFILAVCSLITIYGVTPQLVGYGNDVIPKTFFIKQLIGFIAGFVIFIFILRLDLWKSEKLINIANLILIGMLLILAIDPPIIGDYFVLNINGAKGWFKIPFLGSIQPIEFFKITMIFKLASIANHAYQKNISDKELIKDYFIYGAIPILCVLLQPDLGGAILLFFPWLVISLISLNNRNMVHKLVKFTLIGFAIIGLFVFVPALQKILIDFTPIKSYQLGRINSWLYPFTYDGGYQLQQSLVLMGSAGPFGFGFGNIHITLPEPHTDVIFSEFVGMFGYISGAVLILLYMRLLQLTLSVSKVATEYRDKLLIIGFFVLLFVQIGENIGMMIGLFPITGIVLPFMSYGLSALITYFAIIAIVCNISQKYKALEE